MGITNKTRKILWAKSGGKCAICRIDLAHSYSEDESNHVFGEECHIISSKPTGPRFVGNINYDSCDNLILLCPNDHSLIDKKIEKYPIDELRKIKITHEKWVSKNLSKKKDRANNISHLQKLTTGREMVDIVINNHTSEFNYDEVKTKEEFNEITKQSYLWNIATIRVIKKDNPEIVTITPDIINAVQNSLKESQK